MSCPKCRSGQREVLWHRSNGSTYLFGCGSFTANVDQNEHLHYFCKICKYDWTAPILDNEPEEKNPF